MHARQECKLHRVTVSQCRCASANKMVFYIECPKDPHGAPANPACRAADEKVER